MGWILLNYDRRRYPSMSREPRRRRSKLKWQRRIGQTKCILSGQIKTLLTVAYQSYQASCQPPNRVIVLRGTGRRPFIGQEYNMDRERERYSMGNIAEASKICNPTCNSYFNYHFATATVLYSHFAGRAPHLALYLPIQGMISWNCRGTYYVDTLPQQHTLLNYSFAFN